VFTDPASTIPSLGASGAISGVLAAYLLMFPRNRVMVWIFFQVAAVPALVVIGMWIVVQLLSGAGSLVSAREGGGIAYLAHVGGFVAGVVLTLFLRPRRREPEIAY
jgi:membrane associated rhomboid family serine protease